MTKVNFNDYEKLEPIVSELTTDEETKLEEQDKRICELLGIIQGKDEVITELKEQIEKMKCCGNCVFCDYRDLFPTSDEAEHIPCDDCQRLDGQIFSDVLTNDKWKLREIEE